MRIFLFSILSLLAACTSPIGQTDPAADSHPGFAFPPRVASFTLLSVHVYDDPALGAVANYRLSKTDNLIVSVYLYPTPKMRDGSLQPLDRHSQDELRGLLKHYEGAKQMAWPLTDDVPDGISRNYRQAALRIDDAKRGTFFSLLRIVDYGDTRMKFRISYPPAHQSAVFHTEEFLRAYPDPR